MVFLRGSNFRTILYPIVGGLLLAYLSASIINVFYHKSTIRTVRQGRTNQVSEFTRSISTSRILKKNIFGLQYEEPAGNTNGKVAVNGGESIRKYQLIGTVLGKTRMALLTKDKELKILVAGQSLGKYMLKKVSFDSVLFENKGNKIILRFPKSKKTKPSGTRQAIFREQIPNVRPQTSDVQTDTATDRITIKRKEALSMAQNLNKILTTVRISPFYQKDEFIGYQLSMLRKNSFLYKLGLRRGDILKRINGEDVSSPQKAIELLSRIQDITAVNIDLMRKGEKKSLFINIED
ncbi:MAG: type II secretion system protein GspC [bacterium]|nr:MAG: type II secretion system protein GspC [bacterium]